jgi:plasmid replication initiation protein
MVMQLVAEDNDFRTYTVKIKELADFVGIKPDGQLYKHIVDAIEEIAETSVKIGNIRDRKSKWRIIHWMSEANYDGNGTLTLRLSDEVKPYLLDLKSRGFFTQFQIKEILPMNSFYAIRLYQYLTMIQKKSKNSLEYIEVSIQYLREYLECTNKFTQIGQFKSGVITTALNQINNNQNSEYWVQAEYIKTGRTVTHVRFYIHFGEFGRAISNPNFKNRPQSK